MHNVPTILPPAGAPAGTTSPRPHAPAGVSRSGKPHLPRLQHGRIDRSLHNLRLTRRASRQAVERAVAPRVIIVAAADAVVATAVAVAVVLAEQLLIASLAAEPRVADAIEVGGAHAVLVAATGAHGSLGAIVTREARVAVAGSVLGVTSAVPRAAGGAIVSKLASGAPPASQTAATLERTIATAMAIGGGAIVRAQPLPIKADARAIRSEMAPVALAHAAAAAAEARAGGRARKGDGAVPTRVAVGAETLALHARPVRRRAVAPATVAVAARWP